MNPEKSKPKPRYSTLEPLSCPSFSFSPSRMCATVVVLLIFLETVKSYISFSVFWAFHYFLFGLYLTEIFLVSSLQVHLAKGYF
uniref:Uncharacterized protein n=1 Tax=Cannabis sativa TaxID=3483 RepID=A0A803R8T2_CANSA